MQHVVRLLYHRDRWVCYFAGRSQSRSGFSHAQKKRRKKPWRCSGSKKQRIIPSCPTITSRTGVCPAGMPDSPKIESGRPCLSHHWAWPFSFGRTSTAEADSGLKTGFASSTCISLRLDLKRTHVPDCVWR